MHIELEEKLKYLEKLKQETEGQAITLHALEKRTIENVTLLGNIKKIWRKT